MFKVPDVEPPKPVKRKRKKAPVTSPSDTPERVTKKTKERPNVAEAADATDAVDSATTLAAGVRNKLLYGTTRRQRHIILKRMVDALGGAVDPDHVLAYFTRVEQRIYTAVFGREMDAVFNMYRAELYRKKTIEIIWALRTNGEALMKQYSPELLASLPPHVLAAGTPAGEEYRKWREAQEMKAKMELEIRREKKEAKGEGWYRCPKCGGKFEVRELQMRGGDEPATIFRTCMNCHFTKRNG